MSGKIFSITVMTLAVISTGMHVRPICLPDMSALLIRYFRDLSSSRKLEAINTTSSRDGGKVSISDKMARLAEIEVLTR